MRDDLLLYDRSPDGRCQEHYGEAAGGTWRMLHEVSGRSNAEPSLQANPSGRNLEFRRREAEERTAAPLRRRRLPKVTFGR